MKLSGRGFLGTSLSGVSRFAGADIDGLVLGSSGSNPVDGRGKVCER